MNHKRVWRLLAPVAIGGAVLTLTLLLLYNEPLRRILLEPMTLALLDVRRSLAALPQALLWGLVLTLGGVVLLLAWRRSLRRPRPARMRPHRPIVVPHNMNAVTSLARDLSRSPNRHVSRVRVVRELSVVAVRLLARHRGVPLDEARRMLLSGEWPDDPHVRELLASRRAGTRGIPRHAFLDAVRATFRFLERYHQEV